MNDAMGTSLVGRRRLAAFAFAGLAGLLALGFTPLQVYGETHRHEHATTWTTPAGFRFGPVEVDMVFPGDPGPEREREARSDAPLRARVEFLRLEFGNWTWLPLVKPVRANYAVDVVIDGDVGGEPVTASHEGVFTATYYGFVSPTSARGDVRGQLEALLREAVREHCDGDSP